MQFTGNGNRLNSTPPIIYELLQMFGASGSLSIDHFTQICKRDEPVFLNQERRKKTKGLVFQKLYCPIHVGLNYPFSKLDELLTEHPIGILL